MKIKQIIQFAVVLALLGGCAASGAKYSSIKDSIKPIPAEMGRVYFYRDASLLGAAITSDLYMNDKKVGRSVRGSFFYVDHTPGNIEVAATTETEKKLTFTLEAGETKYVRTTVGFGLVVGRIIPTLVSKDEGERALPDLASIN